MTSFNVYATPECKTYFYRKVFDLIALGIYGTLICAGDFNILLNPLLDTTNTNRRRNSTEKQINKALNEHELNDV